MINKILKGTLLLGMFLVSGCSTENHGNGSDWPEAPNFSHKEVVLDSDKILEVRESNRFKLQIRGVVLAGGAETPNVGDFVAECGTDSVMDEAAYDFSRELVDNINRQHLWVKAKKISWTNRSTQMLSIPLETPSGLTISEELVKNGYAVAAPKKEFDFSNGTVEMRKEAREYMISLYSLQAKAEKEGRGLWSSHPAQMRCMKNLVKSADR